MDVRIDGRRIGQGERCFIIAEVGVNHNGDPALAEACIDAAAAAGADAVKFQTFRPDLLADEDAPLAAYQAREVQAAGQLEMLRDLDLPRSAYGPLKARSEKLGLVFLSTPFDEESLGFLVDLGVGALKIGSGDLDNYPLLARIRASGLPLLLSTGMSTLAEIDRTVAFLREDPDMEFALLQCVSAYPAPAEAQNLRTIPAMAGRYGVAVGFSDHTDGLGAAAAAVALGAPLVEKHLTMDRDLPGPDHRASLDPAGFAAYVRAIREAEAALGVAEKAVQEVEQETRRVARRGAVAVRTISAGQALTLDDVAMRRPATGVSGAALLQLLGKPARREIGRGERLVETDWLEGTT